MARPKNPDKNKKVVVSTLVDKVADSEKESLLKIIAEQSKTIDTLKDKNNSSENTLDMLQKQIQDMQSALIKLQATPTLSNNTNNIEDKMVTLNCRFLNGVPLYSPKREVEIRVQFNQEIDITIEEMNMLLKSNFVREFLKKDVVFFKNEEHYKKFKIFDRYDLSDDRLINLILKSKQNLLVNEFNKLTNETKDSPVFHTLFYRIVDLYNKGKLNTMSYEIRKTIESYFKYEISNAQMLLHRYYDVKIK